VGPGVGGDGRGRVLGWAALVISSYWT
jgi:hypothetical protein